MLCARQSSKPNRINHIWKMQNKPVTPFLTVKKARQIALDNGIHHAYVGNMHNKEADSMCCHACGELVIGRDWYQLSGWQLDVQGCCLFCGSRCVGIFESALGMWGAKRQLVNMAKK